MKKTIFGAILLLFAMTTFAHHIDSQGWCSGKSYFRTGGFYNSSLVQVRLYPSDSLILEFTTAATGSTDTTIMFDQLYQNTPIQIQFRDSSTNFVEDWRGNDSSWITSSTQQLPGCSTLGVGFTNFTGKKDGGNIDITFTNADEIGTDHYNLLMSPDSKTWTQVRSITANGSHTYSLSLGIGIAFLLPFLAGFSKGNKLKRFLALLLISGVIFWSCKKSSDSTTSNYNYAKIVAVSKDGSFSSSPVIVIK